jgi:tRNA-binding EMAP/Myf-like protein
MNNTEFSCEVVRVTQVDKHPNADRLEVVLFEFADGTTPLYKCVSGKGDFHVGDTAVYISDDSIVPLTGPFEFLKTRLDCKVGSTRYRICAAKLRGVLSTGMLLPNTTGAKVGTDMSKELSVSKYESPAETREREYQVALNKKRGPFKRFLAYLVKKVYNPTNVPDYSVVSLRKAPNYFAEGEPVVYTEKIHGSNIRFGKIGGRTYIGSHHTEKSDSRPGLLRWLFPRGNKSHWYKEDVWTEWFNRTFSNKGRLDQLPNNIIFYGELFGPGIQPNYDYGLQQTAVKVFNAWDIKAKKWLSRADMVCLLPHFVDNVSTVGSTVKNYFSEHLMLLVEQDSTVGAPGRTNMIREGIVVHSLDGNKAGKLVSERYLGSKR